MSELDVDEKTTNQSRKTWWDKSAVFIALCALGVSVYTVWLQRDTAKRNSKPYMYASYNYNESGSGFRVFNRGVGPAYLHWFQILVDGRPQSSWDEMFKSLDLGKDPGFRFNRPGAVFRSGAELTAFWLPPGEADQQLRKIRTRVNLKMCYCSIFDDCWLSTNVHAPQEQKSCDPPPPIRYGGFPEEAKPW